MASLGKRPIAHELDPYKPIIKFEDFQKLLEDVDISLSFDDKNKVRIILHQFYKADNLSVECPLTRSSERVRNLFTNKLEDGLELMREILFAIQRHDLLKKFGSCKHQMKCHGLKIILPFRILLLQIYEDIDLEAEKSFLLETSHKNGNLGDCFMDLFATKQISDNDLKYLEDIFVKLKMFETLAIIRRYLSAKSNPCSEILEKYDMKQYPYGKYVIINNEVFQRSKPRTGTNIDRDALSNVFEKFGFIRDMNLNNNLTASQIRQRLIKISQEDHSKYSAFVCCILSHGKQGVILGTDEKEVQILEIVNIFSAESCRHLAGKPKMFIIQACQGSDCQRSVFTRAEDVETDDANQSVSYTANNADLLIGHATFPGDIALRKPSTGSIYINALTQELNACEAYADLNVVFTKVCDRMRKMDPLMWCDGVGLTQIPIVSTTLSKALVLKRVDTPENLKLPT